VPETINLHFCHVVENDDLMPLAIARYTCYDKDDKPVAVEQVTYENDLYYFETEASAALQCGVDVSILTCQPLSAFPTLQRIADTRRP
jgi:hypothetical protein|tara:strand:+ start:1331 stop:1594 length:264 start_codon:yes stop_codon:yes gene_type:complete